MTLLPLSAVGGEILETLLEELGQLIPKIHNLDDLRGLLAPHHPSLRSLRRGLIFLTHFAVQIRYPGDHATKRQAAACSRWAAKIRSTWRGLLGLRPPGISK